MDFHAGTHVAKKFAISLDPIYIDRVIEANALAFERKSVLVVMFIPSLQRDGATRVDQDHWVEEALSMFGTVFGGATAYPQAKGIWRDDERGGTLVRDEPVVIHCYTTPERIEDSDALSELGSFCRLLGRETKQGEVGLVVGDEYFAIRDFFAD
jgi:hypothetical protein